MHTKHRILFGALGGITPSLITLLSMDFKSVVGGYELLDWVGMTVRCLVLVFLGALVAYLHKNETTQIKLFEIGLAAPALLAAIINGNSGNTQMVPTQNHQFSSLSVSIFPKARANDVSYVNQDMLKAPQVNQFSRFLRGAIGTKLNASKEQSYFVIVGSHLDQSSAQQQVKELKKKNYQAKIYKPYRSSRSYAVVIASNVSKAQAIEIKNKAISDGLSKGSYVWTY